MPQDRSSIAPDLSAFLDPAVELMSREDLDRLQEGALIQISRAAYENAPLLRKVWDQVGVKPSDIKSTAEFREKAPFITKDSVRLFRDAEHDPYGGMVPARPGQVLAIGTTSGTTGDPTPMTMGWRPPTELTIARDHWHIGARPGDYLVFFMFTFRAGHRRRLSLEIGTPQILFSMDPRELPDFCEASRRFRPVSMNTINNPLLIAFEQHFERTDDDPLDVFASYKGAVFGGEPLSDRMKALTKSWGLEIFETTGLGEVAGATECRAHDGMHAYEDVAFIECVDPVTGEPLGDGQVGELVVTTLMDRLTPLIRYRTGDLVSLDRSPCRCGRNHARFKILGRASDQTVVQGRSILPREIMCLVETHPETRSALFQIIRNSREADALRLRVGYQAERLRDPAERLKSRLIDHIADALGIAVEVELVPEEELLKLGPPHKIPRVTAQ